jgi:hypothetical protein
MFINDLVEYFSRLPWEVCDRDEVRKFIEWCYREEGRVPGPEVTKVLYED